MTRSQFHTEDLLMLVRHHRNAVTTTIWFPVFVHPSVVKCNPKKHSSGVQKEVAGLFGNSVHTKLNYVIGGRTLQKLSRQACQWICGMCLFVDDKLQAKRNVYNLNVF